MMKPTEYRANAANSIELANRASSMSDKGRLSEKWLDLADRAHSVRRRFRPSPWQHPLLRSKLGDEKYPDAE